MTKSFSELKGTCRYDLLHRDSQQTGVCQQKGKAGRAWMVIPPKACCKPVDCSQWDWGQQPYSALALKHLCWEKQGEGRGTQLAVKQLCRPTDGSVLA